MGGGGGGGALWSWRELPCCRKWRRRRKWRGHRRWGHRRESESGERPVPPRTPTPCHVCTCCAHVADRAAIVRSMELNGTWTCALTRVTLQDASCNSAQTRCRGKRFQNMVCSTRRRSLWGDNKPPVAKLNLMTKTQSRSTKRNDSSPMLACGRAGSCCVLTSALHPLQVLRPAWRGNVRGFHPLQVLRLARLAVHACARPQRRRAKQLHAGQLHDRE